MLLYLKYLKWAQNLLRRNIVVPKSSVPCFLVCHIILALGRLKILPTLFLIGKMFLKSQSLEHSLTHTPSKSKLVGHQKYHKDLMCPWKEATHGIAKRTLTQAFPDSNAGCFIPEMIIFYRRLNSEWRGSTPLTFRPSLFKWDLC